MTVAVALTSKKHMQIHVKSCLSFMKVILNLYGAVVCVVCLSYRIFKVTVQHILYLFNFSMKQFVVPVYNM